MAVKNLHDDGVRADFFFSALVQAPAVDKGLPTCAVGPIRQKGRKAYTTTPYYTEAADSV